MAEEVFSNDAQTVVSSGGMSAPASGMSETWSRTHISHVWRVTADLPQNTARDTDRRVRARP
jgi:hypothetical protein